MKIFKKIVPFFTIILLSLFWGILIARFIPKVDFTFSSILNWGVLIIVIVFGVIFAFTTLTIVIKVTDEDKPVLPYFTLLEYIFFLIIFYNIAGLITPKNNLFENIKDGFFIFGFYTLALNLLIQSFDSSNIKNATIFMNTYNMLKRDIKFNVNIIDPKTKLKAKNYLDKVHYVTGYPKYKKINQKLSKVYYKKDYVKFMKPLKSENDKAKITVYNYSNKELLKSLSYRFFCHIATEAFNPKMYIDESEDSCESMQIAELKNKISCCSTKKFSNKQNAKRKRKGTKV